MIILVKLYFFIINKKSEYKNIFTFDKMQITKKS